MEITITDEDAPDTWDGTLKTIDKAIVEKALKKGISKAFYNEFDSSSSKRAWKSPNVANDSSAK